MTARDNKSEPGVFISYRRSDTGQVAPRLKKDLVTALGDDRIFYDRENLKGGDLWKQRLEETIKGCSVFLALIGKEWLRARNDESGQRRLDEPVDAVRTEIEFALEASTSSGVLIIPVLVDGANMPKEEHLPPSIRNLPNHNAVTLRTATNAEWDGDVQTLLARMRETGIVPATEEATDAWLSQHLQETIRRFVTHMTAYQLRREVRAEDFYIDLLVVERNFGRQGENDSEKVNTGQAYPLEEIVAQSERPLLLIGEGGSGKTTSLLYFAAQAANRARVDQESPVPIYISLARLTKIEDLPDLLELIIDSVPQISQWTELSAFALRTQRRFLFLFDSFNEIPEQFQRTCAVTLQRFVEKHASDHLCLIGSRLVAAVESLGRPPSQFHSYEILRLSSDQVQQFLNEVGRGSLYDQMSQELRDLAGNPFMLFAVAQSLIGAPESSLPRNRGRLYEKFTRRWIENEEKKQSRNLQYSYERVKEPLLCFLAKYMTAAGQTTLTWERDLEKVVQTELEEIYQLVKRRGGMPDNWNVESCLDEIVGDGLLKRVDQQLHFMHQSVQEYFTGLHFSRNDPEVLVDFTPKLLWESIGRYGAEVPNHRFVSPLLMMVGALDDSTRIIEALAPRNPLIAAAAISSSNRVNGSLLASLEKQWLDLLQQGDATQDPLAWSCLTLASMQSPRVIQQLLNFILQSKVYSYTGFDVLKRLGAAEALTAEVIKLARNLSEEEYNKQNGKIGSLVRELESLPLVNKLFEAWRASQPESPARKRFGDLMASVNQSFLSEELQRIQSDTSNAARSADATRALSEMKSWEDHRGITPASKIRQMIYSKRRGYAQQVAENISNMKDMEESELVNSLRSTDAAVRASAAKLLAERNAPAADFVVEELVRRDQGLGEKDVIAALVALCGEETSISKLVQATRERRRHIASFDPKLAPEVKPEGLSEELRVELEKLGLERDLELTTVADTSIWQLAPKRWDDKNWPIYELRKSPESLDLYDCNVRERAYSIIAKIPGEASLIELQRAVNADDENVKTLAIEYLAERGDQSLVPKLLEQLKSITTPRFAGTALAALAKLRNREALSLIDDFFVISEEDWEQHPRWGNCTNSLGWSDRIHWILVRLDADTDIQQRLDHALMSDDHGVRVAVINELARWFRDYTFSRERSERWKTQHRLDQLLDLTLSDPIESMRAAAVSALVNFNSEQVQERLVDALNRDSAEVQVNAGAALVHLGSEARFPLITEVMNQIIKGNHSLDIRRRAGKVLRNIPGGLDVIYEPIQAELTQGGWQRTVELAEGTLRFLPHDVNLFWWRGHALAELGRLPEAAESYERATQLASDVSMIPQALADTFLKLGDFTRAVEAAKKAVEISPMDAEAQVTLARSSYYAGEMEDASKAASTALDLDPVHHEAIWLVLLCQLKLGNVKESRAAFQHAMKVRKILTPGLDESFLPTFLEDLTAINSDNVEISELVNEIKNALQPENADVS